MDLGELGVAYARIPATLGAMIDGQNPTNFVPVDFGQRVSPIRSQVGTLLKATPGHVSGERRRCYFHDTWKGVVMLVESNEGRASWAIFLNGQLIDEGFGSADEAAECAYKRDFDDETLVSKFKNLTVPFNLDSWAKCEG